MDTLGGLHLPTMEEDLCMGEERSGEMGAEIEKEERRGRMQV